jgi:predicted porin
MKKSLLALAALTAFAGVASAQSSVTIFGIVDLAARNVNNGSAGSLKSLSPNGQSSSRLGFRGIEDLGGGLRAGFWLEGDLQADTGNSAGMTWTRRSTVSLMGGFGEARMGRDYVPTFINMSTYDMFGYQGVSTIANLRGTFLASGGAGTAVRANNTISYFLPAMGGVYGQVTVSASEGVQGNKYTGALLGYGAGPLKVSAAFGKTTKSGTAIDDLKTINVGGSFNFGFLTAQASYEKSDYSTTQQKLASAGVLIPVGSGTIKLNYIKAGGSSVVSKATLLGAGYVYDLSKRTSLGVGYGRVANGGNATLGAKYTASGSGLAGIKGGETSTGYDFSVNHKF